jgi:hypothetical protein
VIHCGDDDELMVNETERHAARRRHWQPPVANRVDRRAEFDKAVDVRVAIIDLDVGMDLRSVDAGDVELDVWSSGSSDENFRPWFRP